MARTDIHAPSRILVEDYSFVAFNVLPKAELCGFEMIKAERARLEKHMNATGGRYSTHEHGGSCHICGASAIYTATFYHEPTNAYIRTGLECAEILDACDVKGFRRRVAPLLLVRRGKRKAQAKLVELDLVKAWEMYVAPQEAREFWETEESVVVSIVNNLIHYGSLTVNQYGYLKSLLEKIETRADRRAAWKAEREAEALLAKDVPEGRFQVTGVILSVKEPDMSQQFPAWRMTVKTADGYRVFGSVPAALKGVDKGAMVTFSAEVKRSDRDAKFGFYSRPTKARKVA